MKNLQRLMWGLLLGALLSALLGACGGGQAEQPVLRVAALPIIDKLPMLVAQDQELYAKHGVQVELIEIQSAPERDQLIAAGQADGMINETVSTMFYNKDAVQVQIVRYARAATTEAALFSVLASQKSGITGVPGLSGVEIGISQGTVIEYTTDRILQAEGLTPAEIRYVAVPKLGDRLALVASGELGAGVLPEPLTSLAKAQGAALVIDDTSHPEYSFSTISFTKAMIDEHPEAVRGFLAAIEEATQMINANPGQWKQVLLDAKILPPTLAESFSVPQFVTAGVPSEAQWADAVAWAQEKGLITGDMPYSESVNAGLLP